MKHEIGHLLGLIHEFRRSDRDEYVNIMYDNIKTENHPKFLKREGVNTLGLPYDFYSVMHLHDRVCTIFLVPTSAPRLV